MNIKGIIKGATEGAKIAAKKGALLAGKHLPLVLIIGGGALAVGAVVAAVKATKDIDEELTDLENRKAQWDKFEKDLEEAKERSHNADLYYVATGETIAVEMPARPTVEKVTKKEVLELLTKYYWFTALLMAAGIACEITAYILLRKRIDKLVAALGVSIAERNAILKRIEENYGEDGVRKATSPTKEEVAAKGRREPVYSEVTEDVGVLSSLTILYRHCDGFAKDDHELNIRQLHEINNMIYDYFRKNDVLTMNMLRENFLGYIGPLTKDERISGNCQCWTRDGVLNEYGSIDGRWTGLTFDDRGIIMTDDVTGEAYREIEIRLPLYTTNVMYY